MLKSPLKLFFLFYFSVISVAFSQVNNAGLQYNKWLQKINLSSVLIADEPPGPNNTPQYAHLILRPTAAYQDPLKFALTWDYLNEGFKERGINLDSLLLNKLACYAFLPLHAVSVEIVTGKPDIFSLKISFDKKLTVAENTLSVKGDVAPPINFNFDPAANLLRPYRATTNYNNINIVFSKLKTHFWAYHHLRRDSISVVRVKDDDDNDLIIRVSKIYHYIIRNDNLHESVLLDIKLKTGEIYYSVEATYAPGGGSQTPDPVRDFKIYNDIARDFPEDWINYTKNLPGELSSTLDGN